MNISSVLVRTKPEDVEEVLQALEDSGMCYVYFRHPETGELFPLYDKKTGKIIVVIEAEDTKEEVFKMKAIQSLPKVLSAELIYAYSDEWAKAKDYLNKNADRVPEILNDDNVKAEDIRYGGRVPKWV
ncbi:MAG: chaperone NapD [Aquificae bacterium]|nr:chaperone NapD [Aquificota bacterium]